MRGVGHEVALGVDHPLHARGHLVERAADLALLERALAEHPKRHELHHIVKVQTPDYDDDGFDPVEPVPDVVEVGEDEIAEESAAPPAMNMLRFFISACACFGQCALRLASLCVVHRCTRSTPAPWYGREPALAW